MLNEDCQMKIKADVKLNLKVKEVQEATREATEKGLKDIIVDIARDAIKDSPKLTGNNMRSIRYEAEGLEGSVYSTSGYGGYLETGTVKMPARPYMKPALDRNIRKLPERIKEHLR